MTPTVGEAGDDDAAAIAALHAASWRATYRGQLPDAFLDDEADGDRARAWAERFADREGTLTLVARRAGEPVGFAHSIIDDDPDWGTHLTNLHVAPGRTRQGIGRLLVHETARRLVGRACTPGLHLWVLEANGRARGFYDHLGGEVTGSGTTRQGGTVSPVVRYAWPDLLVLVARTG